MKLQLTFFMFFLVVFSACKNDSTISESVDNEVVEDTLIFLDINEQMDTITYVSETSEKNQIKKEIEQKYGKQWDFCDCVRKNDSITKVIDKMGDDDDYDPVFERMEVIDNHCKELLTTPNTTPEERDKHQKRVKKCLKGK